MGEPVQNTDREATAVARFIDVYREKADLLKLMSAFFEETQELEDVAFQLFTGFRLSTAQGAQLDAIGETVGVDRNGLEDSNYRIRIRTRILLNQSSGTPEEIIAVVRRILSDLGAPPTLKYTPLYPAAYRLDAVGVVPDSLAYEASLAMLEATAAGVGASLIYSIAPDEETLMFADGASADADTDRGFSDTGQSSGGLWAGLYSNT